MRPQLDLFPGEIELRLPPSTRYQGSKLKMVPWLWEQMSDLEFETALDAFGGTGSVAYMLKAQGKTVTYNDYLKANHQIGAALIENTRVCLNEKDVSFLVQTHPNVKYDDLIARTFGDIYFTDEENVWLDTVCQNISRLKSRFKRALAYYGLFQACIIKRPYNLFHRKNLYMRMADVRRSFGNKGTWDKPFDEHFRRFIEEANAAVFDSGVPCRAVNEDAVDIEGDFDLVYIDTPYLNRRGVGVDYFHFYHFLEGMVDYRHWEKRIDCKRKHRPLLGQTSPWNKPKRIHGAFRELFQRFRNSTLVVSYRSDGIPSQDELVELLKEVKKEVRLVDYGEYKYVLSKNGTSKEMVLIGV